MSGLEYCHQNMVAHRDLKLENLVLDENLNLKISDFGLSTIMKDDYLVNGNCGSPHYAAPEVWSRHPYLGPPVDIWSCGVILYIMLCAKYPFQGRVVPDFFHQLENGRFIPTDEHLSSNARDLIAGMLTVNPTQRLTIPEIRQHPWFQA
ncbi:SNF1-related protein kinase catalytic subunit alpha KIN10 [Bienertia sinuspersici]